MPEEKKVDETKIETGGTDKNYLEAIEKLKANSVDKEAYEKVLAENKNLLDSIVTGKGSEKPKVEVKPVDIGELRTSLFNKENSNLEYTKKSLQLREELIKRGETDPFLPVGQQISPSDNDVLAAAKVAKTLKECIDYAQGDDNIFTTELQRVMVDSGPRFRR